MAEIFENKGKFVNMIKGKDYNRLSFDINQRNGSDRVFN